MVSGNIASMYGLPPGVGDITVGGPANFLGFNGDPFSTLSNIEFVAVAGKFECRPQQK
jgi:imidazolonepropionase-like amidohydrolase